MIRALIAGALLVASTACAAIDAGPVVGNEAAKFQQLSGDELRDAVVGRRFVYPGSGLVTQSRCDIFFSEGRYGTCGDRVPFVAGTYEVHDDRICALIGQNERCWQLYKNDESQYLLADLASPTGYREPVMLSPAPDAAEFF